VATTELTGAEDVAWDLGDLYAGVDDPAIDQDLAQAEQDAAAFRERYHGTVAELDAAALAEAIAEYERIESALVRPLTYAHLVFATNMADPARGALVARLGEKGAALDTQLLFLALEWASVEDDTAEALLADPALDALLTGNLDSVTQDEVLKLLRRLRDERSLTLLIVTHSPEVAAASDRNIRLRDGKIVEA